MPDTADTGTAGSYIAVVGSINIDHVVEADTFPRPGETIRGRAVRSGIGGKGANQAVAAQLAGAAVRMLGSVGADGGVALAALRGRGVNVELVRSSPHRPTGTAWITVAEGDNTIVVVADANAAWPMSWPDETERAVLAGATIVLAQLEIPMTVVEAAARSVTESGGRFVLNAAPAEVLSDELLGRCAVLVVNEHELGVVAGRFTSPAEAHDALRARGVGAVVTTLGPHGAIVTDASGTFSVSSPPASAVDTTGAGDAFTGVLSARLAVGESLGESVRWATAGGSLAVRRAGTHDSYPDLAALITELGDGVTA